MKHQAHVTTERTGYCAACTCGWERWAKDQHNARRYAAEHARTRGKGEG